MYNMAVCITPFCGDFEMPSFGSVAWTALVTSPVWGTFAWHMWELSIRPWLVPNEKIKRMADELITEHGDEAAEIASINEGRAWRRSETFEQGMWRRVRKEIEIGRKPAL